VSEEEEVQACAGCGLLKHVLPVIFITPQKTYRLYICSPACARTATNKALDDAFPKPISGPDGSLSPAVA
jgi:hypothetical protein